MADRDRFGGSAMSYNRPRGGSTSYQKSWEPQRVPLSPHRQEGGAGMQAAPIGYNTSETARENYISRTRGGYPDRPRDPFDPGRFGYKDPFAPPYRFGIPEEYKDPFDSEGFGDKDPFDPGRFGPGFGGLPQEMQSEGIGSLIPSNIGFDRMGGPDRALPGDILHMLENPENYRGIKDLRELEEQMDPDNFLTNRLAVGEKWGVDPFGDVTAVDPSDWRVIQQILGAGGNPDDYIQSAGIMGALPQEENLMQQAKVYTNQDPGMIDEGYFWDDISPEAKAINKAYDYLRSKKPIYGSDPQGLRNAIENQLFEDERMYRNMLPESIRRDLPEDAFENLDDFRNQQRIILT